MADRIEQQINSATAAIQKLNREIANLQAKLREKSGSANFGLSEPIAKMQKQLDSLNASLAKKETRRAELIDKQQIVAAERQIASLNKALKTVKENISTIKSSPGAGGIAGLSDEVLRKQEASLRSFQTRIDRLRDSIFQLKSGSNNIDLEGRLGVLPGGAGGSIRGRTIPGGFQPGDTPYVPQADAASKALADSLKKETATKEKSARAAEKARLEEERLNAARNKVASDPRYRQALEQAQARGFGLQQLRAIEDRGGNVQRLKFSQTTGGVNQQFNPYVNLQTGRSTPGLSSQFRSFGSDIVRDIGQFTKWSIAVAAVYTPMKKLGELIAIMVDNESRLADAVIVANVAFEDSGQIFDDVSVAADSAGEGINTTIDAYTSAVRAAGRYTDEVTKQIATQRLLSDSLLLSKLSTLDQSGAIDTLSAALLQSGRGLDEGQELLNKWVRVAQIANVDIATLATGVAVLGDAAETSGLSIDQLNGLIAVLSEQSISGAREAANTAKALVGAYQGDKAEAALNRYGIALRNTNGEVRAFLDVYQDLARLRKEGVLSDAAVSELALALGGGGTRRAKDASALINSQERLNDLAAESAKITGEDSLANEALAKKLQTVQTASTRLSNAFQSLAQTLGDEGGILDSFKVMLDILTGVTKAADELFTLLGRSGPTLATFTTGLLALRAISPGSRETLLATLGTTRQFSGFMGGQAQYGGSYVNRGGIGQRAIADILQMNYRGAGILGGAGVAISGAQNLASGRNEQALGNVFGGIIGAAIGTALGGPIGLAAGATIGSSAGEAMVDLVTGYVPEWQRLFAPPEKAPGAPGREIEDERQLLLERISDESRMPELVARGLSFALRSLPEFVTKNFPGSQDYRRQLSAEQLQLATAPAQLQAEIARQEELRRRQAGEFDIAGGGFAAKRAELEAQATAERQRQLGRLAGGEIRPSEFGRISQQLSGFPSTAIQAVGAYGDEFIRIGKNINDVSDAYEELLFISANGTEEQITQLSRYSTDIRTLDFLIKSFKPTDVGMNLKLTFGDVQIESKEQLQKILQGLQTEGAQTAVATGTAIRLQQLKLPQIVGGVTESTPQEDLNQIIQEGMKIQEKYFNDVGLGAEEIAAQIKSIEAFAVYTENAGKEFFETVEGLNQWAFDAAKKSLEELGKLSEKQGFGFQQFDVDRGTLERLAQQSVGLGQQWSEKFPGFETKPEDLLAITNEGMVKPIHADFRILALLLEKIVDQNQKQLDGQYNIPEGATFWVPLTAAYYRNKGGNDMGAGLGGLELGDNTNATEQNTQALREAAQAFRGDQGFSRQAQAIRERAFGFRGDTGESRQAEENKKLAVGFRGDPGYSRIAGELKEKLPGGTPTFRDTGMAQLLTELRNLFRNIFAPQNPGRNVPGGYPKQSEGTIGGGFRGGGATGNVNTTPTTKLDLRLSSNVNLVVDGRVLANTLQSYLASELLRTEQTTGTITKRYVI